MSHLFLGKLSMQAIPFDDPITLYGAGAVLLLGALGVVALLTYFKGWKSFLVDWIPSVDHKKIGIMYLILAVIMMARGIIQAIMMRAQQAEAVGANPGYLSGAHYNQFFSEHGCIMIFFVAMPIIFGIINVALPLMIGARDVAYPFLNNLSFWLTAVAAMLLMSSLLVGNWDRAGWLAYPPMSGIRYSPGVGVDYFIWVLQISGVGSLLSGINFVVTVCKMRCPGMTWMKMPIFVWASLSAMILVALAFPVLTATLGLLSLDRVIGTHIFTQAAGGNIMMYINLIWAWGHPEVYILILPVFGVISEIVSTFSRKCIFGYKTMVWAIMIIAFLSFVVWLHHFFTMGSGADVNAFFGIATMIIAIPTGVKVFNWLFTMYRGKIVFATPMLWIMAFFTTFAIGGMTGVIMAIPPVDFQTHNSLFLVAHFHMVIIGGVLFGAFGGFTYWFPKMFGFMLDEKRGKYAVFFWVVGFYVAFVPLFPLGLMGVMRRTQHYDNPSFQPYFIVAGIGSLLIFIGFLCQIWQVVYSIRHKEELSVTSNDPWDGRTLEWSTKPPYYNFAHLPTVDRLDHFWYTKHGDAAPLYPEGHVYEEIHMPKNTYMGLIISLFALLFGFSVIWHMWIPALLGLVGIVGSIFARSITPNTEYYIQPEEVTRFEKAHAAAYTASPSNQGGV